MIIADMLDTRLWSLDQKMDAVAEAVGLLLQAKAANSPLGRTVTCGPCPRLKTSYPRQLQVPYKLISAKYLSLTETIEKSRL